MTRAGSLLLLATCLLGCQAILPRYTVRVPPRWEEVRPPRSVLFVSSAIDLTALEAALVRALPRRLEEKQTNDPRQGGLHTAWTLETEPPRLRAVDAGLELTLAAHGRFEVRMGPIACGTEQLRVTVTARSRPTLDGPDLVLFADADLRPAVSGELRCLGLGMPAEELASVPLGILRRALSDVLQKARVPVASILRGGLDELARPRAIELDGRPACLDLAPSAIVVAPMGGEDRTLRIRLGAEVAPRVSLGACPEAPRVPLADVIAREASLGDDLRVDVALAIAYAELQPLLAKVVGGRRFGERGQTITIDDAELGDAGGRALLKARVHGAFNGEVYLWGTPRLVERAGRLRVEVPDLQVALETRSVLERIKLGLWRLLDGGLPAAVKRAVDLDVTERVQALRDKVLVQIDRAFLDGRIRLKVAPKALEPRALLSARGVLAAHVTIVATATLELR